MKHILITSDDLIKFMGKDNYYEFIEELKRKGQIKDEIPIWIIAEWSEKNG